MNYKNEFIYDSIGDFWEEFIQWGSIIREYREEFKFKW